MICETYEAGESEVR